jgi:hypothetical protein
MVLLGAAVGEQYDHEVDNASQQWSERQQTARPHSLSNRAPPRSYRSGGSHS